MTVSVKCATLKAIIGSYLSGLHLFNDLIAVIKQLIINYHNDRPPRKDTRVEVKSGLFILHTYNSVSKFLFL